jgi:hypothetical protein
LLTPIENLDEAIFRRFDLTLKFANLKPEATLAIFEKTCQILDIEKAQELITISLNLMSKLAPSYSEKVIRCAKLTPANCPI